MTKMNLDEVIGKCRECTAPLGELPPPYCTKCVGMEEKRQHSRRTEPDPYKKVWNSVEDEESALVEWAANGTLFTPTYEELARRHESHAHYLLGKARKLGRSAAGIAAFNEAMVQVRLAKEMLARHQEVLVKSR